MKSELEEWLDSFGDDLDDGDRFSARMGADKLLEVAEEWRNRAPDHGEGYGELIDALREWCGKEAGSHEK